MDRAPQQPGVIGIHLSCAEKSASSRDPKSELVMSMLLLIFQRFILRGVDRRVGLCSSNRSTFGVVVGYIIMDSIRSTWNEP
jgi:hypothetical protein